MKRIVGHKIPRGDIVMALCFLAVCACTLLILSNLRLANRLAFISEGCYSGAARELTLETEDKTLSLKATQNTVKTPMILYRPDLDEQTDVRGVYIKGHPAITPPILEGRFFSEEDNFSDTPRAVIGRNFKEDIFYEQGKPMIRFGDVDYEVIGILGMNPETRLDGMRMLNIGAAEEITGLSGVYRLDTDTKKQNSQARRELETGLGSDVKLSVYKDTRQEEDEEQYGDVSDEFKGIGTYVYYIILLTFLLCTVSTTIFWMQKRQNEISIEWMLGLKRWEIFMRQLRHYLPISLIGGLLGLLVIWVLSITHVLSIVLLADVLLTVVGVVLCGILILGAVSIFRMRSYHNFAQELR